MSEFKKYYSARTGVYMRPYEPGEEIRWVDKVHVSPRDGATGSPKAGDYIAYMAEKPDNHFLVSAENFKSYEVAGDSDGQVVPQTSEAVGDGPMVRDPTAAAEAEEQKALNGEASSKTVLTNRVAEESTGEPAEASEEEDETEEAEQDETSQEEPVKEPEPASDSEAEPVKENPAKEEAPKPEPKADPKPAKPASRFAPKK